MAVFVLVANERAGCVSPACETPIYNDVPASNAFRPWIEELTRRGVVSGCCGANHCPPALMTREQIGAFITVTVGLTLHGL